ncbi:hypothetical protein OIO90_001334 [Microbotryomycetes sp. JL221]|nr:hypothetical protein OIO90_001334 [Microbotryomycetes sp. JL221]
MPYIDSSGNIKRDAPWHYKVLSAIQSVFYALVLFLTTLFNPTKVRTVPRADSIRDARLRQQREREETRRSTGILGPGASGGSRAGGHGGSSGVSQRRGGTASMGDLNGPANVRPDAADGLGTPESSSGG